MERREFMALFGGGVAGTLAWPPGASAQQTAVKISRIGIIDDAPVWDAFRQAFRDAGDVEGKTVAYEYRNSNGQPAGLAVAAAGLAKLPVDVIATYGTSAARAAKAATSTIPIVMISVGDPVGTGLVRSLAHPGGNITGNTILAPDLSPKRLQLVKEIIPSASRVALLWNPNNMFNDVIRKEMQSASPGLGLAFTAVGVRNPQELEGAFATLARERPDAVIVTSDPLHQRHIQKIISLMFRYGLPGMYQTRDNVAAGGLMSYGASFPDLFRNGASYAQKILHGAKPGDLPVQSPERFELAINLKTAKAIGLTISDSVLLRADEVIE